MLDKFDLYNKYNRINTNVLIMSESAGNGAGTSTSGVASASSGSESSQASTSQTNQGVTSKADGGSNEQTSVESTQAAGSDATDLADKKISADTLVNKNTEGKEGQVTDKGKDDVVNDKPMSLDDKIKAAFTEHFDGEEFSDSNYGFDKLMASHKEVKNRLTAHLEGAKKLNKIINNNPTVASVLGDIMQGKSLPEALASHYTPDELSLRPGDDGYDDFIKGQENLKESKRLKQEKAAALAKNKEAFIKTFGEFKAKNFDGDDEGYRSYVSYLDSTIAKVLRGEIDTETLTKLYQGYKYEEAVAEAKADGELVGKNASINELKTKEKSEATGDGLPDLDIGGGTDDPKDYDPILSLKPKKGLTL